MKVWNIVAVGPITFHFHKGSKLSFSKVQLKTFQWFIVKKGEREEKKLGWKIQASGSMIQAPGQLRADHDDKTF